jgi:hypothetical protein
MLGKLAYFVEKPDQDYKEAEINIFNKEFMYAHSKKSDV